MDQVFRVQARAPTFFRVGLGSRGLGTQRLQYPLIKGIPRPQRTYLFLDLYEEIIVRNPKEVGSFRVQGNLRSY